jgi:tRNA(adenine34) deaminase
MCAKSGPGNGGSALTSCRRRWPNVPFRGMADLLLDSDEYWMAAALKQAELAYDLGEVPVGAVVVQHDKIIGRGHNQTEQLQDPTAHAEILAIGAAAGSLGSWRLLDCTLYVTVEPCCMCAGAIVWGRLSRLVYGAPDPKAGACGSLYDIVNDRRLNHRVPTTHGVRLEEAASLMKAFFQERRKTEEA